MSGGRSQRRLRNVVLTRKFHFHYFGLWILLNVVLLIGLNVVLYLLVQAKGEGLSGFSVQQLSQYLMIRRAFLVGLGVEVVLASLAIVALGSFTAHRIAGPYIRLRNAFREVADGNLDYMLRFRTYDRLDDVAVGFNMMMAAIRERVRSAEAGEAPKEPPAEGS